MDREAKRLFPTRHQGAEVLESWGDPRILPQDARDSKTMDTRPLGPRGLSDTDPRNRGAPEGTFRHGPPEQRGTRARATNPRI